MPGAPPPAETHPVRASRKPKDQIHRILYLLFDYGHENQLSVGHRLNPRGRRLAERSAMAHSAPPRPSTHPRGAPLRRGLGATYITPPPPRQPAPRNEPRPRPGRARAWRPRGDERASSLMCTLQLTLVRPTCEPPCATC